MENKTHAILCPNCGKLVSRNSEECYNCGYKKPGRVYSNQHMFKFFSGQISYVQGIIIACVGLYVFAILLMPSALLHPGGGGFLNLLAPDFGALLKLGMTGHLSYTSGMVVKLPVWTNITAIYLHGSLLHILFNMLWMRQLGPAVEQLYGSARFFLIFTIAGVAGFLLSGIFSTVPTLGASGSIFGLLGAIVYYGRDRGGMFGQAIYRQYLQWAVVLFLIGFMMSGVNNWAHGGGFIGGYASALFLGYQEKKRERLSDRYLALGTLILTIMAFLMTFIKNFV
ncbi:rhomboid family intramembrane serine protease [candidate division KSB1 bacterium]|nr:rhomboid family intramembrane serine protease [candidate division KSB1 bacterium]